MIKIYTDGSCIGNQGNGGWAAIIIKDENFQVLKNNTEDVKKFVKSKV